ncbi:MAG TPA: flavin reductase family protein [Holophagaceae bacterium]|nr:flavin reductase family protein [Holophagaceae bacterium]
MSDLKTTAGPALGKIPSGLAIATAQHGAARTGFLASWFQQISFEPPLVAVCIKAGRPIEALIQGSGHFALNLLKEGDHEPLKRYGRGFEPGVDPWAEDAQILMDGQAAPVFKDGYAYLMLKHTRTLETGGDHHLVIGEVVGGALQDPEARPRTHVRKDGFGY